MKITLTRPDDWHLHVRDGDALSSVVPHSAAQFGRAIIMPNLRPPVTDTEQALAYRQRILAALPEGHNFTPLMTLYLTDQTTPDEIKRAKESGIVYAAKLYPAGATTNSDSGVTDLAKIQPALEMMQQCGLPLLVHAEVTDSHIDIFDRERIFIERHMDKLVEQYPELSIVFEHVTTLDAVNFVKQARQGVAATITAHHLLYNRNSMLAGGIRPHYYCLPILKREKHRQALLDAATSGNPKFFLGTDSAPHPTDAKESTCGCAGCYTAYAAIELYAEAFDGAGALDKLEGFASYFGADFYQLPRNSGQITLLKEPWFAPDSFPFNDSQVTPLRAGEEIQWRIVER
ncbi:MAG: dihydroorotase [Candidatus Polarisedimenticolaceae bacterium]|nr:dihydroorotase [Candidatus Polarisedimenticolaceae bacterium]